MTVVIKRPGHRKNFTSSTQKISAHPTQCVWWIPFYTSLVSLSCNRHIACKIQARMACFRHTACKSDARMAYSNYWCILIIMQNSGKACQKVMPVPFYTSLVSKKWCQNGIKMNLASFNSFQVCWDVPTGHDVSSSNTRSMVSTISVYYHFTQMWGDDSMAFHYTPVWRLFLDQNGLF